MPLWLFLQRCIFTCQKLELKTLVQGEKDSLQYCIIIGSNLFTCRDRDSDDNPTLHFMVFHQGVSSRLSILSP